ncbi:MAG: hypothetical protein JRH11_02400 [Deltaproteobacteria bacterium]|nr:hypothetical protein [Deltaproteobacteria bacterium]
MIRRVIIGGVFMVALGACEEPAPTAEVGAASPPGLGPSREVTPREQRPESSGPQRWRTRPRTDEEGGPDSLESGALGGTMRRERSRQRPTKAEILARFDRLQTIGGDTSTCEQAFAVLRETTEGMGELLEEGQAGRVNRADYLALCQAFPTEVRRCLTPQYQAANGASCRDTLARFAGNRNNPAWLERLTGHPASERPDPATTEAEGRALRRRRLGREGQSGQRGPENAENAENPED